MLEAHEPDGAAFQPGVRVGGSLDGYYEMSQEDVNVGEAAEAGELHLTGSRMLGDVRFDVMRRTSGTDDGLVLEQDMEQDRPVLRATLPSQFSPTGHFGFNAWRTINLPELLR